MATPPVWRRRRISGPIAWVGLCLAIAMVVVLTTRGGLDILALLVAVFLLLLVERTIGDWLAETIGPGPTALVFVIVAAIGFLYVTTEDGRARADRLFAAADARGFHTTYFKVEKKRSGPAAAPGPPATGSPIVLPALPRPSTPAGAPVAAAGATATGVRIGRLRVAPEVATPGTLFAFRADLSSEGPGTFPAVVFSVDGRVIATVTPDATGVAETRWQTAVPGQYVVRARIPGRFFDVALASTMVTVLPGRR